MKTKFTGIEGKTIVSPTDTLESRINEIFQTQHRFNESISHEASMALLNVVLGVYTALELSNQLNSRTGCSIVAALNKVSFPCL
jgi:hypothetical protein